MCKPADCRQARPLKKLRNSKHCELLDQHYFHSSLPNGDTSHQTCSAEKSERKVGSKDPMDASGGCSATYEYQEHECFVVRCATDGQVHDLVGNHSLVSDGRLRAPISARLANVAVNICQRRCQIGCGRQRVTDAPKSQRTQTYGYTQQNGRYCHVWKGGAREKIFRANENDVVPVWWRLAVAVLES